MYHIFWKDDTKPAMQQLAMEIVGRLIQEGLSIGQIKACLKDAEAYLDEIVIRPTCQSS